MRDPSDKKRLKVYVVSDVHLTSHEGTAGTQTETLRQKLFRDFLYSLLEGALPEDHITLVLNGDILDINESWFDTVVPWDEARNLVEQALLKILSNIIENNADIFKVLRTLLENPNFECVYVFGNHDGILEQFPSAQALFKETLASDNSEAQHRICFSRSYENSLMSLYVEHGHRLDPYNSYEEVTQPPLGDVVNVLVVNRFEGLVAEKMKVQGYLPDTIDSVNEKLSEIKFLRPLTLFPLWVETVGLENLPLKGQHQQTVKKIIEQSMFEILQQREMIHYFVEKLHIPAWLLKNLAKTSIWFPGFLPVLSYITSKLMRKTHSHTYQYQAARNLHQEKGYKLIVYGHTHIPAEEPLSPAGFYINTGSWMPIIRLIMDESRKTSPIDYLALEERFRKIHRCGFLRIEADLTQPNLPIKYFREMLSTGEIFN